MGEGKPAFEDFSIQLQLPMFGVLIQQLICSSVGYSYGAFAVIYSSLIGQEFQRMVENFDCISRPAEEFFRRQRELVSLQGVIRFEH